MRVERTFDHFVVLETLGMGGMGTVYKARDTRLDRLVALKLLRRDLSAEKDHASRFQHEARIAASVNHPNVIQIFSSGTDHDRFYVVMELVEHGSLDDLIEQRKQLPEQQVLESGIQVARGLRAAHRRGLIHRDVKPANILYVDEHTTKISDFGLAGIAGEGAETRAEIWGTPYYIAPERLLKEPEDFRGDIYSLGATLFHAVAGKAPIEGETNAAAELLNLKKQPLNLRDVVPEVSEATAGILQRMIAPDPAQRFSSYDELVSNLEEAQRALTGMTRVDVDGRRPRRWLPVGAALLILLGAAMAMLFFPRGRQGKTSPRPVPAVSPPLSKREAKGRTPIRAVGKAQPAGMAASIEGEEKIRDLEADSWNAALANYKEQVALYNFAESAETIKNVKLSNSSMKQAQHRAEMKTHWLIEWKNQLINDINRAHFSGQIQDTIGGQYVGIASATDESLSLKLRHGIARATWQSLAPSTLLTVSTSFIRSDAPDAAHRQWRCAIFASEFGQGELARQLAESAAKTNPQYQDQIPQVFPDIPERR
jgi:tRNA A-37 threonylcarbamoyl transferase component Bud32